MTQLRNWLRTVTGGLLDSCRLVLAAVTLNFRKLFWIVRGRPGGTAPCQHPSDSGRALETQCLEAAGWAVPQRLCRVCPHLQVQADGRRLCGVDAAAVRPFWRRALAIGGIVSLGTWLAVAALAWAVLWKTGVRAPYWLVVWPGAWHRVAEIRAARYVELAEIALSAGRYPEVMLNIQSALKVDPRNFRARSTLANIHWLQGNYGIANDTFDALLREFPDRRAEIARNWLPKLLVFGEFERIKALALTMLAADGAAAGPWAHALIYASRQTGDASALADALRLPRLPEPIRPVLAAQAAGLSGQRDAAVRLLHGLEGKGELAQFVQYQQIEGLLELGAADVALDLLDTRILALSPADQLYFRLCAYARLGWVEMGGATLRDAFQGIDLPRLNAIAVYLVRHHDRTSLLRVIDALSRAPEAPRLDVTFSTLYLAAGLWGDRDLLPRLAGLASAKAGLPPRLLQLFDAKASQPGRLSEAMGLLPIPMEGVYAARRVMVEVEAKKTRVR